MAMGAEQPDVHAALGRDTNTVSRCTQGISVYIAALVRSLQVKDLTVSRSESQQMLVFKRDAWCLLHLQSALRMARELLHHVVGAELELELGEAGVGRKCSKQSMTRRACVLRSFSGIFWLLPALVLICIDQSTKKFLLNAVAPWLEDKNGVKMISRCNNSIADVHSLFLLIKSVYLLAKEMLWRSVPSTVQEEVVEKGRDISLHTSETEGAREHPRNRVTLRMQGDFPRSLESVGDFFPRWNLEMVSLCPKIAQGSSRTPLI